MANVLIVGASRGIGLDLCRQYCDRGDQVFATVRKQSPDASATGATIIEQIDVSDDHSVDQLSKTLSSIGLNTLIHCAGILTRETFDDLDMQRIRQQFEVNTLGPLRVVSALRSNLNSGSCVGIVSSRVGSVEDNSSGGNYGYRMSKSAVNMVGKNLSHDLAERNIAVALLHPGLVATEMTRGTGIDPSEAAAGIIRCMDKLDMSSTGTFWHAEGYQLPW